MSVTNICSFLVCILLLLNVPNSEAQFEDNYLPRNYTSSKSKDLIKNLEDQLKDVRNNPGRHNGSKINRIYKKRTQSLIEWVRHEMFIHDDSINLFLDAMINTVNQKEIQHPIKTILVSRDPIVNAYCLGEGTIVVNIGLLSKMQSESQLAYVLCHEMAHLELEHIERKIEYFINGYQTNEAKKNYSTLILGDISLEQASDLKNWAYSWGRHARSSEIEADSVGYIYFSNTPYCRQGVYETFQLLDSANYPMHRLGSHLFADLNFSKYPFREKWLRDRLGLYRQEPTSFLFNLDSISSHPEIDLRREKVANYFQENDCHTKNLQADELMDWVVKVAQFETIEGARRFNRYDVCLHQALQLKAIYPNNGYVTNMIVKVLVDLLRIKKNSPSSYEKFVSNYTVDYSEELRAVNHFLHNVTKKELGEIAFHFLNNQSNFDPSSQYHYFLLWQICNLTNRDQLKEKIKRTYIQNFPSVEYCKEMKCLQEHYNYYHPEVMD